MRKSLPAAEKAAPRAALLALNDPGRETLRDRLFTSRLTVVDESKHLSAAIVGYVGAGGIGVRLHEYQEYAQWDRFATVLLCILVLVTVLDLAGERVRARLTRRTSAAALAS